MFTDFQYRFLRAIAPREPATMSGSAYLGKSKLRVSLGNDFLAALKDKVVIDYGCGEGHEAIELVQAGAARVIGIDIRPSVLKIAKDNAGRAGVADQCEFTTETDIQANFIVSLDSFEHFDNPTAILRQMRGLLRPGGEALVSFGPTWYHPLGGHLFSVFPWAHLLFSEAALCRWRSHIRSDGATRFREVEGGLNRMTIARFERLARESEFHLIELNAVPIRKLKPLHNRFTREFTSAIVRARLKV